jgi:polysaccharide pyruvyl transferase WcaK-like protein
MVDPNAATLAPFDMDPAAVKGRLGRARLVIGARLHSLIFAAHSGVPIIGIGYGPKVRRFLRALDLEEFCVDPCDVNPALLQDLARRWDAERAEAMRAAMCAMEDGVRREMARVAALLTS